MTSCTTSGLKYESQTVIFIECNKKSTLRNQMGTFDFLSPLKYKLMTITDRKVDRVISIMLRQKYAPRIRSNIFLIQIGHG